MEPITHYSHEHPLHLLKQKPTEAWKNCYACEVSLIQEKEHLVEVYGCELCETFFLHKHCAELPLEIVHKVHKFHSLFLVLKPPGDYKYKSCRCQFRCPLYVYSYKHRFFYYCFVCEFLLGTECAFREKAGTVSCKKELIYHHPSHHKHHPLMVVSRPTSLLCDACGVEYRDMFYHCPPCHYGIHKRCATLPSTTTLDIHSHPLTLSFIGLPLHLRNMFEYYCDVCEDSLNRFTNEFWLYYCDLCRYFVHIRCMDKKKKQIEVDLTGLDIESLPHLPMSDKSVELIQRYLLKNKNSLSNIQPEISICSHAHPLAYSNDQFLEDDSEILCDACIDPIFSPSYYYHCAKCRYYLHLSCAKLPQQLQHHSHPHLLSLSTKTRFDDIFACNVCWRSSNGFFFHCTTNGCEFNLDLECAALPTVINHAYHNHPLNLDEDSEDHKFCRCCGYYIYEVAVFGCKYCKFYLHARCILLAKSIRHRLDSNHPLILRFPPHAYHPKPFDCYQCETEINPNHWLYHCEECDLSFHVRCMVREDRWNACNMKFGQKVQIVSHPHPLKFVFEASVRSSTCHNCKDENSRYTLECETCNFRLCKKCVKKIEPLS